jgi:hypothetical protein
MAYVLASLAAGGALIALAAWAILGGRDSIEIAAFAAVMAAMFLVAGRLGFMR